MKSILIASGSVDDAEKMKTYLKGYFQVTVITTTNELVWKSFDAILIDHNFTHHAGIDFLMDVIGRKVAAPVLMMTPSEDPQCAVEALRVGAFNYIIKSGNYFQFLYVAVTDAIARFEERAELKNSLKELTVALANLEKKTGVKAERRPAKQTSAPVQGSQPQVPDTPEPEKPINLLEEIVSRFKKGEVNLPTLPQVNAKFNTLIRKGANLKDVADFLKQDVAISTKLINASNSALYRGLEKVSRLEDAINRLGLGTTRQYVEIISNRSLYTASNKRFSGIMERLWEHSLACAYAAENINAILNLQSQADIFSLGLTHDVGKLVLLQVIGELGARDAAVEKIDSDEISKTLDLYHGKFGAVLLKRWEFTEPFREVAMFHNHMDKVESPSHEFLCVHFANCLVNAMGYGIRPFRAKDLETLDSYKRLRLRPDEIQDIQSRTREYISNIKTVV